jgi:Protein of unknown function (DUF3072)
MKHRKNRSLTDRHHQNRTHRDLEERSNTVKDPDNWKTGNEPITGAQRSYLETLSGEAGEDMETDLSKAEASKKIDELQHKTGRGLEQNER